MHTPSPLSPSQLLPKLLGFSEEDSSGRLPTLTPGCARAHEHTHTHVVSALGHSLVVRVGHVDLSPPRQRKNLHLDVLDLI